MRFKGCQVLVALLVSLAGAAPRDARAWDYAEHWSTSYDAYVQACDSLRKDYAGDPGIQQHILGYCAPEQQRCFAHMAAIAADYAENPAALSTPGEDRRYLYNAATGIDCTDFLHPVCCGDANPDDPADARRLFKHGAGTLWKYLTLLASNQSHFQPDAAQAWSGFLERMEEGGALLDTRAYVASAAFALHFLEDSFPSGHMGVNRRYAWHEYDNGYHDDFNYAGRFVSTAEDPAAADADIWYTFGDGHLGEAVPAIAETALMGKDSKTIRHTIEAIAKEAYAGEALDEIPDDIAKALGAGPSSELGPAAETTGAEIAQRTLMLSLPKTTDANLKFTPFRLCGLTNHCAGRAMLIFPSEALPANIKGCAPANTADGIQYWKCGVEARARVVEAAEHAIRAMLLQLVEVDAGAVAAEMARARSLVPRSYLPMRVYLNGEKDGINGTPSLLQYETWREQCDICDQPTSGFGYGLARESANGNWNDRAVLSAVYFTRYSSERRERTVEGCSNNARAFFAIRSKIDVVDTNGEVFNGVEGALLMNFGRPRAFFRRALGFSPVIIGGVERLWEGSSRRNYFYGAGLSIDMFAGRRGLYLEFDQLWHRNEESGTEPAFRVMFNIRVTSVHMNRFYPPSGKPK